MMIDSHLPGRKRHLELNGGMPPKWRITWPSAEPTTEQPDRPVKLYAIVSTWHDADVVAANVANCLAQGCERVYLLDNDSPDDTVQLGLAAGAVLGESYTTKYYDDDYRSKLQNDLVKRVTEEEKHSELWWLHLDADEFPVGLRGLRVIDLIAKLPRHVTLIGSNHVELYPTSSDQYVPGEHPASCMDMGIWRRGGIDRYCECGHWKHPLLRYHDGVWDVAMSRGNHIPGLAPNSPVKLIEPDWTLVTFHAPYRREEDTRKRLRALCATRRSEWDDQVTKNQGAIKRFKTLDYLYTQCWREVDLSHTQMYGRPVRGVALYPWRVLAPEVTI